MEIYCAHCKRKTPTNNLEIESHLIHTKAGKEIHRNLARGNCSICGTKKQQFVASDVSEKHSSKAKKTAKHHKKNYEHTEHHTGEGQYFMADKKYLSKQTYNALVNIANQNKKGTLKIMDNYYDITPAHIKHLKKANEHIKKNVAKVLSNEKTPKQVIEKESKKGSTHIPMTSNLLRLFEVKN
jgi:hypothetical protein